MKAWLVLVTVPGIGHLQPILELAKRLLLHYNQYNHSRQLSIIVPVIKSPLNDKRVPALLEAFKMKDIYFIHLPTVELSVGSNLSPQAFISTYIELHIPFLKEELSAFISSSVTPIRISAFIIDFFCTSIIDLANEFNVPTYMFFTSPSAMLSLMLHLPTLDQQIPTDFISVHEGIKIPGMSPVPSNCLPKGIWIKKSDAYDSFLKHGMRFREVKGILANSYYDLEPEILRAILAGECIPEHLPQDIFPIGPVITLSRSNEQKHECLIWLDRQPPKSVVFLCFGSMGAFASGQIREIALGLEQSGYRFLWSLRAPSDKKMGLPRDPDLDRELPPGFLDRTKERGLVRTTWLPQTDILSNPAIGGFVSHCGWNSILESLWFSVPILTWPIYAEQNLNAFLLCKELGLAVKLEWDDDSTDVIAASKVERGVKRLMEEDNNDDVKRVREKVEEISRKGRLAVAVGGTSFAAMDRFLELVTAGVKE